jgi:diguanylate cyclase (GGDEF)-like protein
MIVRWSLAAGLLLATAAVDALAAGWVWRRRGAVGRVSLTALLAAAAVWCAAYGVELITVGRPTREFWGSVEYLGTTVLPVAWLCFVLEYTGRREQITPRLLGLLAVEPVVVLVLLTHPVTHTLIRSFPAGPVPFVPVVELGPVYWVHFVYTTALAAIGIVLLVTRLMRVSSLYRRQSITLAVAVMLPLLGNTASSLGLGPARTYDPTPIAVSLSGLVLVWGAFRYRLLDLLPVARTLAFDRLGDPVLVVDVYGRLVDRNPAASRALGDGAAIGAPVQDLLQEQVSLLDATAAGAEIRVEHGTETKEFEIVASPLGDDRGRHAGQLLLLRDITARKRAERQLRWLADYDQLTGLPNRRLLVDRLDQAIARARRAHGRCALLLVDLDRFKLINDSLGHQLGDQVLAKAGARLRAGRREEDTAARMGGDEFALVLPEVATPADAALVARRVLTALAEPMLFGDRELIVTASAGVAVWPDDGAGQQQLFSCADAAMYRAKEHGRNRSESGATPSDETATERLELGVELYHALRRGELRLAFQPLVDLQEGMVLGMEALLRWQHPVRGTLPPATFLPVAAQAGLSTEIDRWVLAEACGHAARWARAGRLVPVSVNISAERFRDAPLTLTAEVAAVLEQTSLPPEMLILEISERTIIDDPDPVAAELLDLRKLGVGMALDDFGAGHTSLTHLRRLPIGVLKIDRELIRGVGDDTDDMRILSAVTTLAHILGMRVIAEGVERPEQVAVLQESGCDAAQGFLFSPPVAAEATDSLLVDAGRAVSLSAR